MTIVNGLNKFREVEEREKQVYNRKKILKEKYYPWQKFWKLE
jgi:hypothetical protein